MIGNRQPKDRVQSGTKQITKSLVLLREIDEQVDFSFFAEMTDPYFSDIGRKSIDPAVMLKMMFLGLLFGVRSEAELIEECIDRHSFREFLGYDDEEDMPVHTNFSNWRKRLGPEVFENALEQILSQCESGGMRLGGLRLFDSTRVKARASTSSSAKHEFTVAEQPDEYLAAFAWQTNKEDQRDDPRFGGKLVVNTNDIEARLLRYGAEPSRFVHKVHFGVDSKTGLVVNTTASFVAEHKVMLDFLRDEKRRVDSVCADSAYGEMECYRELERMGIKAYIPLLDDANDKRDKHHLKDFGYNAQTDTYTCPNGKVLSRYMRDEKKKRTGYRANKTDCAACPIRDLCIEKTTKRRTLTVSDNRPLIEKIKSAIRLPAHKRMMCRRKAVIEGTNANAKERCGMSHARGIGLAAMRIQAALTAIVINVKKLLAFLRKQGKERGKDAHQGLLSSLRHSESLLSAVKSVIRACRATWRSLWLSRCNLLIESSTG